MPPERANLILPTDIPHIELDILIRDRFDVEADSRDGRDVLVEPELVQNGYQINIVLVSLSGRTEANELRGKLKESNLLVFPAASNPSIRRRISFDPKTLLINLDTCPPIAPALCQKSTRFGKESVAERVGTKKDRTKRRDTFRLSIVGYL
jgi:hypothetical protein